MICGIKIALTVVALGSVTAGAAVRGSDSTVKAYTAPPVPTSEERMTVKEARRSIAVLNAVYQSTLRQVHRRFPVGTGQPVVAALVLRDVQRELGAGAAPASRFLAVKTKAMNPDHEPRDVFERRAAEELARGARWVERIEEGRLRAATPVPLGGGCFPCHSTPAGGVALAAISWSVPIKTPTDR